jgi:Bacterial SH3 domain
VAPPRHKHVLRDATPRRRNPLFRVGVPVGALLVVGAPAVAAVWPEQEPVQAISMAQAQVRTSPVPARVAPISRSEERVKLEEKPPTVADHMFSTTKLNVRTEPSEKAPVRDVLEWAEKVAVSGETKGPWAEVVIGKEGYWVHKVYLSQRKPKPEPEPKAEEESAAPAPSGLSAAPCASGSDVESGLAENAIAVHRATCALFPDITSYGGVRPGDDGEHGTGQALDIMISGDPGWEVAEYVRANAGELGVSEVIYSQKIWTVDRGSEGWRYMEDRGSTTANHYDHVHVTVY